jgi:serpin B
MGMELPFDESADFSDMAETSSGLLYIGDVLHKTYIQLDRNGTKAAAATTVEMTDEADVEMPEPKTVYLDRPFVYAIVDAKNGMPLFLGAVNGVE